MQITFLFSHNRHANIPVALIQPDDSIINCFISGDEYYHWFHDENNYTIIQSNKDGYYYYAIEEFNEILGFSEHVCFVKNSLNF